MSQLNKIQSDKIAAPARSYICLDEFKFMGEEPTTELFLINDTHADFPDTLKSVKHHQYKRHVKLKQSMLVMLQQNLDIKAGLEKLPRCYQNVRKARDPTVATVNGDYDWMMEKNIERFIDRAEIKEWPIVNFGRVGKTRMIYADYTVDEVGDEKPYSLFSRTQIPPTAGWAVAIHKSQGMTLDKVISNLARSLEQGQMYVALSRARSFKGLHMEALGRELDYNEQVKRFLLEKK